MNKKALLLTTTLTAYPLLTHADVVIQNFTPSSTPTTHYDTSYNRLDAHDGGITQFNDTFYLYGTSYNCGFQWGTTSPWCGFESYSSKDLKTWVDRGKLFDPAPYQTLCGTKGGGCFRPHVIYNKLTSKYVLWFEGAGGGAGTPFSADYHALTSDTPTGPFTETLPQPNLTGGNNPTRVNAQFSDFNLFTDDDGRAYVAYDDADEMIIDQLNLTYTDSNHKSIIVVTGTPTHHNEAPALFKRNNVYYLLYGASCGYCTGTDTSYSYTSGPILGAWMSGGQLNPTSCGGQSSNVATLEIGPVTLYLYESDIWLGTPNEAAAGRFNQLLTFADDSAPLINSFSCDATVTIPGLNTPTYQTGLLDAAHRAYVGEIQPNVTPLGASGVAALNGDLIFSPQNSAFRGFNLLFNEYYDGTEFKKVQPGPDAHITFNGQTGILNLGVDPNTSAGLPVAISVDTTGAVTLPGITLGTPTAYACLDAQNKLISSPTKCTPN